MGGLSPMLEPSKRGSQSLLLGLNVKLESKILTELSVKIFNLPKNLYFFEFNLS